MKRTLFTHRFVPLAAAFQTLVIGAQVAIQQYVANMSIAPRPRW